MTTNQQIKREQLALLLTNKIIQRDEYNKAQQLLKTITEKQHAPWFVQVLQGLGAWLSALMFIAVFAFMGILHDASSLIVAGLTLLVIALVNTLYDKRDKSSYTSQLLFAISLTGHVLITIGIGIMLHNIYIAAISLMLISIIFLLFYQHSAHKFLSVHLLLISLLILASDQKALDSMITLQMLIVTFLTYRMWIKESRYISSNYSAIFRPVQYALVSALLIGTGIIDHFHDKLHYQGFSILKLPVYEIMASAFFCCFFLLIRHILQRLNHPCKSFSGFSFFILAFIFCLIFYHTPSLLAALLVLLLGIERNNSILIPLAIIAFIYSLGRYYYNLELTLFHKSLLLIASGSLLLITGFISYRYNKKSTGKSHYA